MCVYFGRCSRKGRFSCNGESAAADLLDIGFVEVGKSFLDSGGVEALRENRSEANDVLIANIGS